MRILAGFVFGALVLPALGDSVVSSSSIASLRFDFIDGDVRTVAAKANICPIACNSATNWRSGGYYFVSSQVRVYRATASDPSDVSTWETVSCTDLSAVSGEGTVTWDPPIQSLYKLELRVDGAAFETAYFDLRDTGGLPARISLDDAVVTLSATTFQYTGKAVRPSVTKVELDGTTLVAGTDYDIQYADNVEIGTATARVLGTGDYKGEADASFAIVAAESQHLGGDDRGGCRLDGRTNDVLVVRHRTDLLPFAWNTSENFNENGCEWVIGGLSEEKHAVATVTLVPMASRDAEPDELRAVTLVACAGEGAVVARRVQGIYEARLALTLDGVAQSGMLKRIIEITDRRGLVIYVR